jgi:hypothetical protein
MRHLPFFSHEAAIAGCANTGPSGTADRTRRLPFSYSRSTTLCAGTLRLSCDPCHFSGTHLGFLVRTQSSSKRFLLAACPMEQGRENLFGPLPALVAPNGNRHLQYAKLAISPSDPQRLGNRSQTSGGVLHVPLVRFAFSMRIHHPHDQHSTSRLRTARDSTPESKTPESKTPESKTPETTRHESAFSNAQRKL